jgi:hypothetical protein
MRIAAYANRYVISVPLDEMAVLRAVIDIGIAEIRADDNRKPFRKALSIGEKKAFSRWFWKNPLMRITRDARDYRQPPRKRKLV